MAADAGELRARATLDNTEFLGALKEMVQNIQDQSANAATGIQNMEQAFSDMAAAVGTFKIAEKIGDFASACIDAAKQLNSLKSGFDAVNGASAETTQAFTDLQNLALSTGQSFTDTIGPAAKQMMLMGASATDTAATMTSLVDAAAGLKQGPDWINAVAGALDNMEAHQVVSTRDMKALSQEGIDGYGALADQMGVSIDQAMAAVKNGTVTAQTVVDAVTGELGDRFEGAASLAQNTWGGAMGILGQASQQAQAAVGNSILAVMNDFAPVLIKISGLITDLTNAWKDLNPNIQDAILAFGGALTVVGTISAAIPVLTAAFALLAAPITATTVAVGAAIAALGLIGKWVYDEWPAIKAVFSQLWDDIVAAWQGAWNAVVSWFFSDTAIGIIAKWIYNEWPAIKSDLTALWDDIVSAWQSTWSGVTDWFTSTFSGIADAVTSVWDGVKTAVGGAVDWLGEKLGWLLTGTSDISGAIKGFFADLPGASEISKLAAAWKGGQDQIDATAASVKAHTQAIKDNASATTEAVKARQKQEAADLAAANQAKKAAAEQKAADAEAAKQAADQQKYNDELQKTYTALAGVAPDVAKQFADMYGGMTDASSAAQKLMGKDWDTLDASTQQLITDTLALGEAYKTLGITSVPALEGALDKAAAAYDTLATSGTANSGVMTAAMDGIVKKQQSIVDLMSTDMKDAYTKGQATQQEYYDAVIANAQKEYDTKTDLLNKGIGNATEVAAAYQVLEDAKQASAKATQDTYTAAMQAVGDKTQEQLDAATAKWADYYQAIKDKWGDTAAPTLAAQAQVVQSLIDQYTALGKPVPDDLVNSLKKIQDQLEASKPPADQFADAMRKLGVNTTADAVKGLNDMAAALVEAKKNSDDSVGSEADLAAGQQDLTNKVQAYIDKLNGPYKQALSDGSITQTQYLQDAANNAQAVLQQFTTMGNDAPGKIALVTAATTTLDNAVKTLGTQTVKDTQQAFHDLGVKTPQETQTLADKAVANFDTVAQTASSDSLTYQTAWINATKAVYDNITADGTSLSSAQKDDLAKMEAKRDEFLAGQQSTWGTAYKSISTDVSGTFDSLTKLIVTGDGSFGQIMTNLWQGIAEAALNAFIAPLKKAITDFVSNELASLISALTGIQGQFTSIGNQAGSWFPSGGGGGITMPGVPGINMGGGGGGGGMPGVGGTIPSDWGDPGGLLSDAASNTSSAADSASSAASGLLGSVTGIVGAVGAVGSMITGAIGDIQTAHTNNLLAEIEKSTRYSMIYLGGGGGGQDSGIIMILWRLLNEVAFGYNTQANENMSDQFINNFMPYILDNSNRVRAIMEMWGPYIATIQDALVLIRNNTTAMIGWGPYIADTKDGILAIRDSVAGIKDTITSNFQAMTITINAGMLTTADAARQLGNQIAANLTGQLATIKS